MNQQTSFSKTRPTNGLELLLCMVALLGAAAPAAAKEPTRDIRHGTRQLLLDDWVISKTSRLTKEIGKAIKHPNNPLIRRDQPWDRARADLYGSAVYDPEHDRIQLFYAANNVSNGHEDRLAYAESYDQGKTWTKPLFDLIPFETHRRTNLVMLPPAQVMHGPCVFRDDHETNPAKRYKLLTSSYPDTAYLGIPRIYEHRGNFLYSIADPPLPPDCGLPGMYVAYSPDGVHWQTPATYVTNMMSDTAQSAHWNSQLGKYVAYVRARTKNGRSVARMTSHDFEHWTKPQVVLEDATTQSLYSMGVTQYEGLHIGTPWIYDTASESRGGAVIWPELASSRDGIKWERQFPGQPLVPPGAQGSADSRQIRMSSSLVVLNDRILLFYGQTNRPHEVDMRIAIGMATLRLDGFATWRATKDEGVLLTRPLRFKPGVLSINAQVEAGGHITVEVVNSDGKIRPGFEAAQCQAIVGRDSIEIPVAWKNQTSIDLGAGKTCRLRFRLKKARLYSFWVANEREGSL